MQRKVHCMEATADFILGPAGRTILTIAFGLWWKVSKATITRAYPAVSLVANIALAIAGAMLVAKPETQPAAFALYLPAAFSFAPIGQFALGILVDGITSCASGVGIHSWFKNLIQWRRTGGGFFVKVGGNPA